MTRSRLAWSVIVVLALAGTAPGTAARLSAQAMSFTRVGSIAVAADLVEISGGHAYIAGGPTLTVVDVSNPSTPKRLGAYTFPEKIWGFKVVGSLVYVAADFFGLGILDLSKTTAPALKGSIKTPGQAKSVAIVGTKAAVADHMSGVDYIDVSNPAKPVSLGSFYLDGYARDVAALGSHAYAVDAPTGVYVFDLTKPGPLDAVSTQQSATAPGSIAVAAETGQGPKLAVLVGGGSLQIYDLADPAAPVKAGTYQTPSGRPRRVALEGSIAYVADGEHGLQVVDLAVPAKPAIVGAFNTTTPARDVAVSGSVVLVAVGAPGEGPREIKEQEVLILRRTP